VVEGWGGKGGSGGVLKKGMRGKEYRRCEGRHYGKHYLMVMNPI